MGSTWLAVYETKYARVSQPNDSSIPCARISHCQRSAIGSAVPIMIATASANHHGSASSNVSTVLPMSTFQTRYVTASAVKRSVSPYRERPASRREPAVDAADGIDRVEDVLVGVRGRERQREHLVSRPLRDG